MSEQAKHTPGPWAVRPDPNDDWGLVRAADGKPVADAGVSSRCQELRDRESEAVSDAEWVAGPPEVAANACLIAAAPDLLAACESLAALAFGIGSQTADGREVQAAFAACRAAIAKAEGAV